MIVSSPMIFLATNSTVYLVSTVDGTMLFKELNSAEMRFLLTRFHVLAIILSFALTLDPSEVLPEPTPSPGGPVELEKLQIEQQITADRRAGNGYKFGDNQNMDLLSNEKTDFNMGYTALDDQANELDGNSQSTLGSLDS
ncbi:hypothetical protein Tco_0971424 [Tanacetum coccineum]